MPGGIAQKKTLVLLSLNLFCRKQGSREKKFSLSVKDQHMIKQLYQKLTTAPATQLAVLVDPDKQEVAKLEALANAARNSRVDYFFVGGSLLMDDRFQQTIEVLKKSSNIPVVIFPGNNYQVSAAADAILLLSLISGRNPEYLIGQHVIAAPALKASGLEIIPTGYLLIDGGRISTTSYITQTVPVPADKIDVAVATALAGAQLGLKAIYLEAGSGAKQTVPGAMVSAVKQQVQLPLLVGGGIRSGEQAENLAMAGADVLVVGNALEKSPELLMEIALGTKSAKQVK